ITSDPWSPQQQFAFIKGGDKLYLYSIGAQKFVEWKNDGAHLTDMPTYYVTVTPNTLGNPDAPYNIAFDGEKLIGLYPVDGYEYSGYLYCSGSHPENPIYAWQIYEVGDLENGEELSAALTQPNATEDPEKQAAIEELRALTETIGTFITEEVGYISGGIGALQTTNADAPNYIWCNEPEANEGPIADLIDGNVNTFFHSCWNGRSESVHWLQVNLEAPISKFEFSYVTRYGAQNDFPTAIEVQGSNDGATFSTIETFGDNLPQQNNTAWQSGAIVAQEAYKYLRFVVTAPRVYFHMAEFTLDGVVEIADEYRPHLSYIKQLDSFNKEAKAICNNDSLESDINSIIALSEKLNIFYSIKEEVFNGNVTKYGTIGNLVWTLKENNLTINGAGAMPNGGDASYYPWYSHRGAIGRVTIGDKVTHIGNYAFYYYNTLTDITLGSNLKSIGNYTFYDCDIMKITTKATTPPTVGNYALNYNDVRFVYVPETCSEAYKAANVWKGYFIVDGDGVTVNVALTEAGTLGDKILEQVENFSDVNNLTISGPINSTDISNIKNRLTNLISIDMSEVSATQLEANMFEGKGKLQKAVLPKKLTSIPNYLFRNCYMLEEIEIPASVTVIGTAAFNYCKSLRKIDIPEGVTGMNGDAFSHCENLYSVKLPSTLTTVATYAFYYNTKLKKVEIPEGVKYINQHAFQNCAIDTLKCPSTLYSIGNNAFNNNDALVHIDFNEGLQQIYDDAFYDCDALTEITLPSTLVLAYQSPFTYCSKLNKVTCLSVEPPYMSDSFKSESMAGCELYVPAISLNIYKQTEYWDDFPTIKPIDYLPQDITVLGNHRLTLPEEIPADYKPSVSLIHDRKGTSYWHYGSLTVGGSGTLSVSTFNTLYDYNCDYDSPDRTQNHCSLINNATMRADSVLIEMIVRNDRWIFFSLPFDAKVSDIMPTSEGTTNFVIRRYDGEKRAAGETDATWVRVTADETLNAGEGYILQCSRYVGTNWQNYSCMKFKAINNTNKNKIFANSNATVTLNEYQSEFIHNRSWNLIGNPYPSYYDTRFTDLLAPITVWNFNNNTYTAYSPVDDSYILRPGEAFFVQCPVDSKNIIFNKEGRQTDRTARTINAAARAKGTYTSSVRSIINLTISDGTNSDKTRIVLNDNAAMQYEMDKDASKFMSSDPGVPQIFSTNEEIEYAINERPLDAGIVELGTRINIDGDYTIALANIPEDYSIYLLDKKTGEKALLNEGSYPFTAEAGEQPARFSLVINREGTTGIYNIDTNDSDEADIYNLNGVKVKEPLQRGIYIRNNKKIIVK
ncbi:MAG: leucine-rich repeat protein, partial [Bacteroidaceae bacterium]|nr:leucine-rich repeat protein [Bacteroidaceae bacterium]